MGAEGFDQTSLERPQLSIQHSNWHNKDIYIVPCSHAIMTAQVGNKHQEQAYCQHSKASHCPRRGIKCANQIGCRRKLLW